MDLDHQSTEEFEYFEYEERRNGSRDLTYWDPLSKGIVHFSEVVPLFPFELVLNLPPRSRGE